MSEKNIGANLCTMPRGFCGGSGAVKNSFRCFIGLLDLVVAHLAPSILYGRVDLAHEGIEFSIQIRVVIVRNSQF